MKEMRNPFRLRRAENIDTEAVFLTLFEPGVLDALQNSLPSTFQPLRSASGGGKTSLLRLFRPGVLRRLYQRRGETAVSDLYEQLERLGAFDEAGPCVLGVPLQCGRNYTVLEYLEVDERAQTRLFFSLLNSRIVLATLRNALELAAYSYPEDLPHVRLEYTKAQAELLPGLPEVGDGVALHRWARSTEQAICAELDSFGPLEPSRLPGHNGISALDIIRPSSLVVDGRCPAKKILILMDDVHQLSKKQRRTLIERATEARSKVGIWIAERFEALTTSELLASGSDNGRDHHSPIEVERYWRKHYKKFEKHVMRLADRRVSESSETELRTFAPSLGSKLGGPQLDRRLHKAIDELRRRLDRIAADHPRFKEWVASIITKHNGTLHETAISMRALEILIRRELSRKQVELFADVQPLGLEELEKKNDSSLKRAAELFLARENNLPYYYGPAKIARLASVNIQQFLGISAALFDEIVAAETLHGGGRQLPPERQHEILKAEAQRVWNDIPNKVRNGRQLQQLLSSISSFARWYTYRPTAPNDPGVAGTAIRMRDRELLLNDSLLKRRSDYRRLADLLATGLAHNYLIADLDYKCKGESWMVLNLNRILCVHFDLPLGYGLYKERPLDQLCRWIDKQFSPSAQEKLL